MHDSERDRIFGEWLAGHKGILFKVVHAYAFEHAALLAGGAMYLGHRAQAWREPRFGESLRDQLNRSIAQLDYQATTLHGTLMLVIVLLGGICPIALLLALSRLNEKSFSDDGYMIVWLSLMCVVGVATGVWELRRQARDVVLQHKRRLEASLKELDAP